MDVEEANARVHAFLSRGLAHITDAPDSRLAAWQVSFAMGAPNCIGHTMSSKAEELGYTVAAMSKGAVRVCRMLGLPPSPWMIAESRRDTYRNIRKQQEEIRHGRRPRRTACA